MEGQVGFFSKLRSFLRFLPFFILLFLLGLIKAAIVGPIVVCIITIGNSSVVIGLWTAHFIWTYYCVIRTERLTSTLKILVLFLLPLPLLLWPMITILGSLLGGVAYGVFSPLLATFEAVGENVAGKFFHCFADGFLSTIEGSLTIVRDFTDLCFHSYFSFMDDLRETTAPNERPLDIKLSKLPCCMLACPVGVLLDVPCITVIAILKSPLMLLKGWKRLIEDLIGREGPFLETVCVPFAGIAILLWPLACVGAVIAAIVASFFLGLYSGVIAYQEDSLHMGLAYTVAVVSLFDEYVNDLLYLGEGSCLPRPVYRKRMMNNLERKGSIDSNNREGSCNSKLSSQQSWTLKQAIQHYRPLQVWDWLFKSCEVNGQILLRDGLINGSDIGECILKGNCKKLVVKLPTWSILQCLLTSAKMSSAGLAIYDDVELTKTNGPRDRVFDWFIAPLFIIKEQIKSLQLTEDEEILLRKLVMKFGNEKPEEWDDSGFPSEDRIRRAQLQAIIRRLQGIVSSMSRFPTFRRRFRNLVKVLYLEALQATASSDHIGSVLILKPRLSEGSSAASSDHEGRREASGEAVRRLHDDRVV